MDGGTQTLVMDIILLRKNCYNDHHAHAADSPNEETENSSGTEGDHWAIDSLLVEA